MIKVAVIDDYQNAFQQIVDIEKHKDKFDFKVFNEPFVDEKEAAVELEDFEQTIRALVNMGFSGVNVTIPHKLSALKIADKSSSTAQYIGAANTLTFTKENKIYDNQLPAWIKSQVKKNNYSISDEGLFILIKSSELKEFKFFMLNLDNNYNK